jgi:hypothetical protein
VVLGAAYDGLGTPGQINMTLSTVDNPTVPDGSSLGADGNTVTPGNNQGVTEVGTFLAPNTGGWSSNDLIPLRDTSGNLITVNLEGVETVRLTFNKGDGDADFLLFYNVGDVQPPGPEVTVTRSGNDITIGFSGALESTDSIGGTWAPVAGATAPSYTTQATDAQRYYRSSQPE